MNRQLLISMVLAGAMVAGTAFAGPYDGPDRGPRHGGPDMAPPIIERIGRALRNLDLSDDQRQSVHAEMQGLKQSMQPLVQSLHENRKSLHELVTADEYDSAAVAEAAEKQGAITAQMTILASATAANVLALLDEEQRAQLEDMAAERQEFRADHKKRMKEHKDRHRDRQPAPTGS